MQALWAGAYTNGSDKPRQMVWSQLSIKILLLILSLIRTTETFE